MMRKGYRREVGSEGSAKQRCEPMDKNRIRGASVGRAGNVSRSPYPSRANTVNPAGVRRRLSALLREICTVSFGTEEAVRRPDRSAEVSRGHSVRWAAPRSGGFKSLRRSDEERCIQRRG